MFDPSPRRFRWRVALPTPAAIANRMTGLPATASEPELPGPDGIRHALVARVRAEIAAGIYDTEEKWLAAEEALLARVTGS